MQKKLTAVLLCLTALTAHAEKWVSIGDGTGTDGATMYADTDSASRKGALASIMTSDGGTKQNSKELARFDCVQKDVINAVGGRTPLSATEKIPAISAAYKLACGKWYEVWK